MSLQIPRSQHPPCTKFKNLRNFPSWKKKRKKKEREWRTRKIKKSQRKRLEKITRGRYLSRHRYCDWVARTFYLRRDWTVANQSIDFTCFLRGRYRKPRRLIDIERISGRYRDDRRVEISTTGRKKWGRERLPGEELRSTGGYWTCARWFHPFQDGCLF